MPSQLKRKLMQEYPFFSSFTSCIAGFFAGIDPPHALVTEASLLPPLPPSDPRPAPVPSPTQDPGPGETPADQSPTLMPVGVPTVQQPEPTSMLTPRPNHGEPNPEPHFDHPAPYDVLPPDSTSRLRYPNQGNQPTQGNDPKQDSNPNQTGRDPTQVADSSKSSLLPGDLLVSKRNGKSDRYTGKIASNDLEQTDKASSIEEVQPVLNGIADTGTSLIPSAPPISISGIPTVYGLSVLAVGSSTTSLAFDDSDPKSIITHIAGQAVKFGTDFIAVAGTTLSPGASAITVSGTSISLGSSALVIGASTIRLSQSADPFVTTVAGHAITAASNAVEIAGTILHPGIPGVILNGTVVSVDTAGHLIVNSKTVTLATLSAGLGKQILGAFENDPASNDPASNDPASNESASNDPASDASVPLITTVGNQAITAASTGVAFAGTTLTPGAPRQTIGGTLISLNTAGQLVVGAQTILVTSNRAGLGESGDQTASDLSYELTTTIAGQAVTAGPTAVTFAGTTLTKGAPGKTVAGTLVSLNTAGQLVVGSKTIGLTSESAGLGGLVMGAFGASGPIGSTMPAPGEGNVSNGTIDSANTRVEISRGEAEDSKSGLSVWKPAFMLVIAMALLI